MTNIQQAAILCGGRGTRMRPLTDTMPKPMAPVNGKPFLAYLIEQLRDAGIQRVVLLTGYLGEMIRDYFGDGRGWGVAIDYSHGPAEWDTGKRVWEARRQLEPRFMLLYSDNIVPFSLSKLEAFHRARAATISLLIRQKTPGNIALDGEGGAVAYNATRSPDLSYVELGYMLVERDAMLAVFDDPEMSFSIILQRVVATGNLSGFVVQDAYHSISDPARWRLAEQYLALKRILLIDRDGTINRRPPRAEYVTRWEDFQFLEPNVVGMERLAAAGFQFIVLTNQAGIGRGDVTREAVDSIHARMIAALALRGIDVLDVYICPHDWDEGCDCRKPAPGMLLRASKTHLLRMDRTFFVGDDPRDAIAADRAECLSVLVGPERDVDPGSGVRPAYKAETLLDAVPWITNRFDAWAKRQTQHEFSQ